MPGNVNANQLKSFVLLSIGNQQLRYEHSVAERKMAIARTALETIANNGETDPGVRKLARETLDGFDVLSDGEQVMGFFAGVQQDQPIPEVDTTALRQFHERSSNNLVRQALQLASAPWGSAKAFQRQTQVLSASGIG